MNATTHGMLTNVWFALMGLMLIFYVITDGFDLGVGILSLLTKQERERDQIFESIGHVWDANETWLVVLGGAMFGAFPEAYATLLTELYVPMMALIAGLILRGAAIEFRHSATNKRIWDCIFGIGSLGAAAAQGVVLGNVITGLAPGALTNLFIVVTALGVISGYALLGATYLIKKTSGKLERTARFQALVSVLTTVTCAVALSAGTMIFSSIGHGRWAQPGVFELLFVLACLSVVAIIAILYSLFIGASRGPFNASVALFICSFSGLAISLFPDIIPGRLSIAEAASDTPTLLFMLCGIGLVFPIMIGYNLYQYHAFRGKVLLQH
jgi:cytochrome d ubiquinol oxidase subunit II